MSERVMLERATPESQGVASSAVLAFVDGVESQHLGLHSMMLLRHGRVVAEGWWRPFGPDIPHILYSLTKSFTSTAAGLTISEGKLSLDDPVLSFFKREAPKDPSPHWAAMRVRHLLSMATGHEVEPTEELARLGPQEWLPAMFRTALPYAPGTHFLYNSMASHLVSIIVERVTGQKLASYLRDRLFKPLGFRRPYWETDPLGHNWGGWGLYLRTEEIARFGQMVLDYGRWQGQQLVPREWFEQATFKQIDNGSDPNSDWAQGYGFQYWMSRHGFRGDGAFGQFCVVLRDQGVVLATTASTSNMQAILDVAWQTLLPGLNAGALAEDRPVAASLQERLRHLQVEGPQGEPMFPSESRVLDRTFRLDENRLGWQALGLHRDGNVLVLTLTTAAGEKALHFGTTGWEGGEVALDMPMALPVAGSARWSGEDWPSAALWAALIYLNPAATRTMKLSFTGNDVEVRTVLSGTFAPPDEIVIQGR